MLLSALAACLLDAAVDREGTVMETCDGDPAMCPHVPLADSLDPFAVAKWTCLWGRTAGWDTALWDRLLPQRIDLGGVLDCARGIGFH